METYIAKLNAMEKCIGVMVEDLEVMHKELKPKYEELEEVAMSYAKAFNEFDELYHKTGKKEFDTIAEVMYDKYTEYENKMLTVGAVFDKIEDMLNLFVE